MPRSRTDRTRPKDRSHECRDQSGQQNTRGLDEAVKGLWWFTGEIILVGDVKSKMAFRGERQLMFDGKTAKTAKTPQTLSYDLIGRDLQAL